MENRPEKRTAGILLAAAVGTVVLAGCGNSDPTVVPNEPGTVVGHEYDKPYKTLTMVGKIPVFDNRPEEFHLDVKQCGRTGDPNADQNGCVTADVKVTEQTYDQYPNGSTIAFTGK